MNLQRVKRNGLLVFPYTFPEHERQRGGPGYVVDLDAPLEAEWCRDQEWKLEPAPEGSTPSKITSPQALRLLTLEQARRDGHEVDNRGRIIPPKNAAPAKPAGSSAAATTAEASPSAANDKPASTSPAGATDPDEGLRSRRPARASTGDKA